ncbi:uncharacterized protein LOC134527825 [Bacillus rossius redtenbacheri]|uniref:uncharacterized protein LOC134527825 n=1 Tax=Bacillus rossius redtenbacheri TaxID=93214 RepID=UPI002FDDB5D5
MVRTYKRKTSRAEIPEDNISKEIEEILGGASIRSAAAKYDLTKSMLHKRMSKMKASSENSEICVSVPGTTSHKNKEKIQPHDSKYTSKQIFTKEEEAMLEEYLIQSSKMQFGLTYLLIREFAYSYAVKLCRPLPSNWTTQKMAGTDWMKSFMKRHPALSLRKPESTSIGRNISFNQYNISSFFDNLDKVLSKHKFSSSRIINVDESGISTVLPAPKVVAPTGCKQVGQTVSGERGEQVTFVGIVSAAGKAFPPVYIFPRVRFKEAFLTGSPPGSIGLAIQNGWMTRDGFLQVMKHIQEVTAASKENPILVLLDNHDSHTSLDLVVFCRENGIVLLTFPPHCTHRIQPLDIAVFGPFKSRCKTAFNSWMASNPGKPITIYNIGYLSEKPFIESFSQNNICAGFEKSGIFPLNRDVFTDEDFMPSNVTEIHMVSISTDGNLEKSTIPGPSSRLDLASIQSDI